MNQPVAEASPRGRARIAGAFYLVNIVSGALALRLRGRLGVASLLVATACYLAVTFLFYGIFRPVNKSLSFTAALFSLVACALGVLGPFHLVPIPINNLIFFGAYCLLIGYLISRSIFMPRILGALMALGGLGWMTFISPPLAHYVSPYNMAITNRVAARFRREPTTVEAAGWRLERRT